MRSELLASLSLCSRYKRIFWLLSYWTPVSEPMSFNMDSIQRQSLPTCHLPQLIQKWFCSSRVTEKEKCWKWNTRCRLTGMSASLSHVVWGRHQTDCSLSLTRRHHSRKHTSGQSWGRHHTVQHTHHTVFSPTCNAHPSVVSLLVRSSKLHTDVQPFIFVLIILNKQIVHCILKKIEHKIRTGKSRQGGFQTDDV